ncbi:PLP-dependent transferase [Annulohypoxylon maeteangense]|uniref:PLP-dependent transferase n=1 Tax=Annulohypoxylon maeteangense TaxID=1927788 RepID=UPI002007E61B|nr:PLP-dependent transferase [Annulohypoxylon maeteangense]KAI0888245.1 PLP-dependent transferase [Annulohypoxylon maeteangense]
MPESRRQLDDTLGVLLARRKSHGRLRRLSNAPPNSVDFSSNGYLSLSTNPVIQKSLVSRLESELANSENSNALRRRSILGSGGSRLLDGNSSFAESLEAKIASFHNAEAALLFTSAFDANTGLLSCVPQPGDVIIYDELIHASVHDGTRMSRATKRIPFSHDSISETHQWRCSNGEDGHVGHQNKSKSQGLDDVLKQLSGDEHVMSSKSNVFICIEGLYSMDGDVPLLKKIVETVDQYLPSGNGYIIVDEAHSVGVFGEKGNGLVCKFGLENRIWARVLGFGKAMGCAGGAILCSSITREYLINYARSLIYTTSMTFTSLSSIDVVYEYLISGHSEPLRQHLETLIGHTYLQLHALCARLHPGRRTLYIEKRPSKSPIIPIFTAHPRNLAEHCQRHGFMVRPIVAPTVPAGSERVRICLHSANTPDQIDGLCDAIGMWVQSQMATEKLQLSKQQHKQITYGADVVTKQDKPRL